MSKARNKKSIAAKLAASNDVLNNDQVVQADITDVSASKARSTDLPIRPMYMFVDRAAGAVAYETVFGETMSVDLLIRSFREDGKLVERLSVFYRGLGIEEVLISLMGTGLARPSDIQFGILDLKNALSRVGKLSATDAIVVADQVAPVLRKAGFRINVPERFMTTTTAPRRFVMLQDLRNDAAAQFAASVLDKSRITSLQDTRYSPTVLANNVAVELRSIGMRLLAVPSFARVFDDLLVGVRSFVDQANAAYAGVPEWLRTHPVVEECASNLTFLMAAFDPKGPKRAELQMGERDLQDSLTQLAATLKASSRYANVSLKALAAEYDVFHGLNYDDETAFAAVVGNVAYQPGIMTALPTSSGTELKYLDPYASHVGEVLAAHDLGILRMNEVAEAVVANLNLRAGDVASWPQGSTPLVSVTNVYDEYLTPQTLLALVGATSVYIRAEIVDGDAGNYTVETEVGGSKVHVPRFVYAVTAAPGRRLPAVLRNQMLDANSLVTTDANVALLLMRSARSTSARIAPDQLPPAAIYGARLLNVKTDILQKANDGVKYTFKVGGTAISGEFFIKELDAVRTISSQAFLINGANVLLAKAVMSSLIWAIEDVADIKRKIQLNGAIYNAVLDMACRVSKPLREEVHAKIITAAVRNVTADKSIAMRSEYNRSMFAVQVDLFVLRLYLKIIGAHEAADILNMILDDEGMQLAMSQRGSDRRNKAL